MEGEFVEERLRDSGEVTKRGAGWGGHQWACVENQLSFPALWRRNFYAKGEKSLRAKKPGSFGMGWVTWVMVSSALAGNQHFWRTAVATWVHYRGSGGNGMATEVVSRTHLDWGWMELRRENKCQ